MKVCNRCNQAFTSSRWACPACAYEPAQLDGVTAHAPQMANDGGGFKSEYFDELAGLEKANFWFRARNQLILWALHTYASAARNFLEVGCGTGFVLSGIADAYPQIALSGSEIFVAGLSHAAKRAPKAEFMQMDARQVPFREEYDAVGAFDVLEHIEEDERVLGQLYNTLKPGGVLLLTVPQHPWLWSVSDDYACHVRRYTKSEINGKIKAAGFEILKSTSFVSTILPAMMASRLVRGQNKEAFDPVAELRISPFLNKAFYFLMKLEFEGIKRGLAYPVGGSRLVIAKKVA